MNVSQLPIAPCKTHISHPYLNMKNIQFHHAKNNSLQVDTHSQISNIDINILSKIVDTGPSFVPSQAKTIVALVIREGKIKPAYFANQKGKSHVNPMFSHNKNYAIASLNLHMQNTTPTLNSYSISSTDSAVSLRESRSHLKCNFDNCSTVVGSMTCLRKHIKTHLNSMKRFPCPYDGCKSSFTRKDNMKYHFKTHFVNKRNK